jgi:hypothetical protein
LPGSYRRKNLETIPSRKVPCLAAFFMRGWLPVLVAAKGFRVSKPHFAVSDPVEQTTMTTQTVEPLSLRPRDAAKALGISPRTLWGLTAPRGPIPCLRVGNGKRQTVLYPVAELQAWLSRQAESTKGDDDANTR